MTTKELSLYLNNEDEAEVYLFKVGVLKRFDACVQCGFSHIGRVRRGKYKCYECKTEWNLRKDSYLERRKISLGEFIGIVKFFADSVNASRCAEEIEVGIKPTRHIYRDLRLKLIGRGLINVNDNHDVTFTIRETDGQINISIGGNTEGESSAADLTATRSKDSNTSYFYRLSYNNLSAKKILNHIDKIDNLDNFYRFCQERVLNFRGRDMNSLADTLQELAYRYNHRNEDIFNILINQISQ
ncbi:MAG: hypothetical protein ACYCVH_12025 [Ignavibacteriaceae bacterium]